MNINKLQHIIATFFASALLITAGCSNNTNNVPDKSDEISIAPIIMTTEKSETHEITKTVEETSDNFETPESSQTDTKNSQNTVTQNSDETSKSVSSLPSKNKVTSNKNNNSKNTTNQNNSTQNNPTTQQNSNAPTTSQKTTNTQNNTSNKTQTQNVTKPSTATSQNKEITSISLDKLNVTLDIGEKVKLNLTIYPSDVTHKAYTYSTSDNYVAGIDVDGVITAKAAGTAQITVTTDNGKTAQCSVTVRKPDPTSVSINKNDLKLSMNDVYMLSASNNVNSDSVKYTWLSNNTNCIKIISDNNQTVTIKAVGCGTATLTVKTKNNISASCKITVSKTDDNIKKIVNSVNNERTKNGGLPLLANRTDLNELANIRAKEIVEKFSHTRPDGSSCFSILENNNVGYISAGENIAYGQPNSQEVMTAWMNSKGHRENILSPDFNCIGVGHYQTNGIDYWVQIFIGD